ncbi:MAG TPA: PIG-L family deacetylase [Candidatus Stackebrandtia faecavium]|nr:PIG-L family deacetylase [Candidatus Stackebrandtia faecavium]
MNDSTSPLAELREDNWQRALAIVAHPDDLEYGAAGAIARWTRMGKEVGYLLASQGEAGMDNTHPRQAGPLRVAEQIAAAEAVGVSKVDFLDYPDGLIENSIELRRDLAAAIRVAQPQLVITINHHDSWGPGTLNMADHRHVGTAAIDAVRDAANRWLFTESSEPPWSGVHTVAVAGSIHATHAVDISDTLDAAIASLACHRQYLESLGDHAMSDPEDFLRGLALQTGQRFGSRPAAAFELIGM